MKKTLVALGISCASFLPFYAQADAIGLYVGGQVWESQADGRFGESSDMVDFNLKNQTQSSFYLAVEHPFPIIPNAKVAQTTLDTKGSTTLTNDFEFGGGEFDANTLATTNFDLSYTDYTLYYELFDNGAFSFDFGLTARDFDGDVVVTGTTSSTDADGNPVTETITGQESVSDIVPMFYASTIIGLPMTGFNVFAEGNFLSFDDHIIYDYQIGVSYELVDNLAVDVNLTAGYKAVKLELEDLDDLYTDVDFDGVFAGVVVHF